MPDEQTEQQTYDEIARNPETLRYVNLTIINAVKRDATEIQLESLPQGMKVRCRTGDVWHDLEGPPTNIQQGVVPRIKMMANMDVAPKHAPQEGKVALRISSLGNRDIDMYVRCSSSQWGEDAAIEIRYSETGGNLSS